MATASLGGFRLVRWVSGRNQLKDLLLAYHPAACDGLI